jgi:hypothetical protein
MKHIEHHASRRKRVDRSSSRLSSEPTSIFMSVDLDDLTRGGFEIYCRTRRPVPTCNLLASIAGLGAEPEVR